MDNQKDIYKYSDYEERLIPLLRERLKAIGAKDKKGFSIVGVTTHFIQEEFGSKADINLGGTNVPVIMVAGDSTSIVYYFALKPLLDEINKADQKKKDKNDK